MFSSVLYHEFRVWACREQLNLVTLKSDANNLLQNYYGLSSIVALTSSDAREADYENLTS